MPLIHCPAVQFYMHEREHFEPMLTQDLLIIVRTVLAVPLQGNGLEQILRVAIRTMDAVFGR